MAGNTSSYSYGFHFFPIPYVLFGFDFPGNEDDSAFEKIYFDVLEFYSWSFFDR